MQSNVSIRVLVVEDEPPIRKLIAELLKREGYLPDEAGDGEAGLQMCSDTDYHLVIVDWMLPRLSGLELTRWLRKRGTLLRTPVLFVTAKPDSESLVLALEAGADDYVVKPFDPLVLIARVNSLLRRSLWLQGEVLPKENRTLALGRLQLHLSTQEARLADRPLDLTPSEFRLLAALVENQGKVLARSLLVQQIQGTDVHVTTRTVDTHVFGLRKKLGEYAHLIETIRGVGYRVRYFDPKPR